MCSSSRLGPSGSSSGCRYSGGFVSSLVVVLGLEAGLLWRGVRTRAGLAWPAGLGGAWFSVLCGGDGEGPLQALRPEAGCPTAPSTPSPPLGPGCLPCSSFSPCVLLRAAELRPALTCILRRGLASLPGLAWGLASFCWTCAWLGWKARPPQLPAAAPEWGIAPPTAAVSVRWGKPCSLCHPPVASWLDPAPVLSQTESHRAAGTRPSGPGRLI